MNETPNQILAQFYSWSWDSSNP